MANTTQPGGLEMTTFKLTKGNTYKDFITANADVDQWLQKQPGFRSRHIAQRPDGTIMDALIWESEADGTNAMHRLMSELADSPVHDAIDQGTVSWNIYPVYHQLPDGE
jgi:antibiotic biosynthesis monooxygenase (ABM) superfamily enzyme